MNVEDYLSRIDYTGGREPNLENLRKITWAHKISVPYTNLQIHGGSRLHFDLKQQYDNIVTNRGGGVCYEINGLFVWLLRKLGYKVKCIEGAFFSGKFTCQRHHLVVTVDFDELGRYIVDPGWLMVGPMKMQVMLPYVDDHHVYRLRHVPGENNVYYLEKHKKTLLDKNGAVLKQGPSTCHNDHGVCYDEECLKDDSSHWQFEQRICDTKEYELEDFEDMIDHLYSPDCILTLNLILVRMKENSYSFTFGKSSVTREIIDPLTERLLDERPMTTNADIERVISDVYKFNLQHPITNFKN